MDGVPLDDNLVYPNNLRVKKYFYFLLAPTLTFQLAHPRSRPLPPLLLLGVGSFSCTVASVACSRFQESGVLSM